jgi:uncharacterized membrane protein YhaH (DUF805 family)
MWNSVVHCLRNYAVFAGRAARPEYWWFYLFIVLVNVPIYALADVAPGVGIALSWLWGVASIVPFLAAMSRRLHDTDHSFWWGSAPLLVLVPAALAELLRPQLLKANALASAFFLGLLLAFLVLVVRSLVLLCSRGTAGANRYGDPPLKRG